MEGDAAGGCGPGLENRWSFTAWGSSPPPSAFFSQGADWALAEPLRALAERRAPDAEADGSNPTSLTFRYAPVVQWQERLPTKQIIASSNLARRFGITIPAR